MNVVSAGRRRWVLLELYFIQTEESRTGAHALLDRLLEEHLGPGPHPILRLSGGKPTLADGSLSFNISHSGPYALCGLSDRPLGVDVECIRPRRSTLPQRLLSEEEFAWFTRRGSHWEDFFSLWTLKESAVKYTGEGLRRSPRNIPVPLLSPGECALAGGLWFRSYGGEGWRAACCSPLLPPEILSICHD